MMNVVRDLVVTFWDQKDLWIPGAIMGINNKTNNFSNNKRVHIFRNGEKGIRPKKKTHQTISWLCWPINSESFFPVFRAQKLTHKYRNDKDI